MASQPPSARGMRLIPRRRPHAHATSRLTHKPRLVHSLSLRVRLRDPPWTQAPNHPRTRCTVSDVFGVDNPPGSRSSFPESEAAVCEGSAGLMNEPRSRSIIWMRMYKDQGSFARVLDRWLWWAGARWCFTLCLLLFLGDFERVCLSLSCDGWELFLL